MNRPWKTWLVFGACAAVVLVALGWISLTALSLEQAQLQAGEKAELEERVRLALWRMDSALAPLIVEESARPWSAYEAFSGSELAYTKGGTGYNRAQQGEVLVPSPLLAFSSSNVLLHFQYGTDGQLSSPQVPVGQQLKLAGTYAASNHVAAAAARLAELGRVLRERAWPELQVATAQRRPGKNAAKPLYVDNGTVLLQESGAPALANLTRQPGQTVALNNDFRQVEQVQQMRNNIEYNQRATVYQNAQQQANLGNIKQSALQQPQTQAAQAQPGPQSPGLAEGTFKPFWLGNALVLARRVRQGGSFTVQGVWLNWTNLRTSLLASVRDLLPAADLQPARQINGDREERMLAALPVKLLPGGVPASASLVWTPVRLTLALAWACVLVAALAVALLLHGALSLSERRAAFVSAVTHELRTPLTTFKMYSEMLADDMVPDPARRRHYLETLCSEANRLSHLVENVLAYARLERGSARRRVERITLGELLERVKPRLLQRGEQAGLTLAEEADGPALATMVHVDVAAVEQILFNLVDNACKYATPGATEKVLHLEALPDNGRFAMLRVRDHGQGISAEAARRLFKPFSKSADEAARTAPGVGLGLALCRRLSRSMGGDLRLDGLVKDGACFVLSLPIGAPGAATIA
jgi:signal transduction histidine kinase